MLRKSGIMLLEVLAGMLAIAILAGGILAVRLQGAEPIRLSFLTPYLEQALNNVDPNFRFQVGSTMVTWAGWKQPIDLTVRQVRIANANGQVLATLPELAVELSVTALLFGKIAPSAIEISNPRLILLRTPDGRLQVGFGESNLEPASAAFDPIAMLLSPPTTRSYLRRITMRDARLTVIDRRAGTSWHVPSLNFELHRSWGGIEARADASLTQPNSTATVEAVLSVPPGQDLASLSVTFAELDPRTVSGLTGISAFDRISLAAGGSVSASITRSGAIADVAFALSAGSGEVSLPEWLPQPVPITAAELRGRFDQGSDRLELETASLALRDGPTFTLSGTAGGLMKSDVLDIAAEIGTGAVSPEGLMRYWPEALARGARSWIAENIAGGMAEEGHLTFAAAVPRDRIEETQVTNAEGYFRASGLNVTYLKGLPPLQGVAGEGRIGNDSLLMTLTAGRSGALSVAGGTVEVTSLSTDPQIITIDGHVQGPLRDALELLNRDRLGYPKKMGIDPKTTSGDAQAHLWFRLPALKHLTFDQVSFHVDGEIRDAAVRKLAFGTDVESGDLAIALERDGMTIKGTATVAGARSDVEWRENFGKAAFDSRIKARATVDDDTRAALGFVTAPWLTGPTPMEIIYTRSGQAAEAAVSADLKQATLTADPLGWSKLPGIAGTARATVQLQQGRPVAIEKIAIDAGDLTAGGTVVLNPAGGAPMHLSMPELAWGDSRLHQVEIEFGPEIAIHIGGGILDAATYFDRGKKASSGGTDSEEKKPGHAFHLAAPALDELRTGEGRMLARASLDIAHDGQHFQSAFLSGVLPGDKSMLATYGPDAATGKRQLQVTSDDAGALLRTLHAVDTVVGGNLTVQGEAKDATPGAPILATVRITDYRVVRGPVMAQILAKAKLEDINKKLANEGIAFAHFTGKLGFGEDAIVIDKARAYGPLLGITARGRLDLKRNLMDIEGTIVPAYIVSQIIGEIPLIGRVITGGEGEGVFAATYTARGTLDDPQVSVNPLAALAPGFLRGLFNMLSSGSGNELDFTPLPQPSQK